MLAKCVLSAAVLIAAVPGLHAKEDSAAQGLLHTVLAQHGFLEAASSPVLLEADFTGQANVPMQGHFKLRWESTDHWWSRVDFGPFQQILIRNGQMEYTLRNYEYTPLQVTELFRLFDPGGELAATETRGLSFRTDRGVKVECVQARFMESFDGYREFCADASSHDLLSNSWLDGPDQSRSQRFADYVQLNQLRYPRELDMFMNSSRMITARITTFKSMPFDLGLLQPPQGAMERHKCLDLKRPEPVKKKEIHFEKRPEFAAQNELIVTVSTDGSVSDLHLLQSGGSNLDAPSLATLKEWKFKPAMCGNQPVVDDILVEVMYQAVYRSRYHMADGGLTGVATVKLK
jgi:hypothetical protein